MIWVALSTLLIATLRSATPLLLAALGGIFSERSGVVNIALEGIMLSGAWGAVFFSYISGNAWVGLLGAILVGVLMAGLHAVASIKYHADQVVSGTAINLLATGFTEFMLNRIWGQAGGSPSVAAIPNVGGLSLFVYLAFGLAIVSWFALYRTPWGLRLRSVGEHPLAADTVGINVYKMRYAGVLLSGVFGGLAGASLSIGLLSRFVHGMSAGKGFIALAAVIFGNWNPLGAMGATLLFGASESLGTMFQIFGIENVPTQFFAMTPYVLTMLALAGFVGRSVAPAADGVPYKKTT
ncbi:simple sugar transport system permease protein [Symbiobacterium terraclitae]|uniref:Simple sugar transport system permease protein n=1 Tax=Symbiobacterium terraclitae TaxID=557451 RepID=A0ABS4JNM5_9FIRM|nr:ABC transporter permease [Symbiobacterium terraclitae]MBP2017133.1 simple sugar transport system permease protein [Symbiobacterium terraclitae]